MKKINEDATSAIRNVAAAGGEKISNEENQGIQKFIDMLKTSMQVNKNAISPVLANLGRAADGPQAETAIRNLLNKMREVLNSSAAQNAQAAAGAQNNPAAPVTGESLNEGKVRTEKFVKSLFNWE